MANYRGSIFAALRNVKQLVKPVYTITFRDHIKNVKQILHEYDRVNWPLASPLSAQVNLCISEYTFYMKIQKVLV